MCVQALFRPVSMCVPDMALIVEIMLMSEGFNMSKMLSRKFVILYRLCEDLLSKSKHYDWKLRAIKTTLYVAGGMKRSAPDLSEDKVPFQLHCLASVCMALQKDCSDVCWLAVLQLLTVLCSHVSAAITPGFSFLDDLHLYCAFCEGVLFS